MKNILKSSALFLVIFTSLIACKIDEIDVYNSKRALFFPKYHPENTKLVIDSVFVSFSHYPDADELEIPFRVSLIGANLEEDLPYSVSVVDAKTTALKGSYDFTANPIFRKGMAHDTLWVKIKRADLGDEESLLVMTINETENFELGFSRNVLAKLAFSNIKSQPAWWTKDITNSYFGAYSYKKYQTIIIAAGEEGIEFSSTEGLTPTEIRNIALITQDYIAKNNIKEEDGKDMIIVAY